MEIGSPRAEPWAAVVGSAGRGAVIFGKVGLAWPYTDRPCDRSGRRAGADGLALDFGIVLTVCLPCMRLAFRAKFGLCVCPEDYAVDTVAAGKAER